MSTDGLVAFAEAGSPDAATPTSFVGPVMASSGGIGITSERVNGVTVARSGQNVPVVSLFRKVGLGEPNPEVPSTCETKVALVTTPEYNQAVSVAFNPIRPFQLLALLREPAQLLIAQLDTGEQVQVTLSDQSMLDTGHDLFHQSTPSGLACASCHPEGGEDGRVWLFNDVEQRRTQSLEVGLRGTEPFHWRGELAGVSSLMTEVFFFRMGGPLQNEARVNALADFIFELEGPAPMRVAADALALQGKALFESAAVGCATCHSGENFSDNKSYDVGTGEMLQVPSLVGVAYRAPLMHDGCAADLWARFEPSCGGSRHGSTAELTVEQVNALVAYMESL
jgi:cytochrome c553